MDPRDCELRGRGRERKKSDEILVVLKAGGPDSRSENRSWRVMRAMYGRVKAITKSRSIAFPLLVTHLSGLLNSGGKEDLRDSEVADQRTERERDEEEETTTTNLNEVMSLSNLLNSAVSLGFVSPRMSALRMKSVIFLSRRVLSDE